MSSGNYAEALKALRSELTSVGPLTKGILDYLAPWLIKPIGGEAGDEPSKKFNDPIWKTISLTKSEVLMLDMPLMQRLRRVRQLGLAYLVFPSAHHSRFEHSLGAVHVANRIFSEFLHHEETRNCRSLERVVRFAALLHDCGHSAFSHVGERALLQIPVVRDEFERVRDILVTHFKDDVRDRITEALGGKPADGTAVLAHRGPPAAELVSVLLVLSEAMEIAAASLNLTPLDLMRIASLIMGRPFELAVSKYYPDFLKSIVSGDLDADKLDYVARDAYFAGIPIAGDVDRLISQLSLIRHSVPIGPRSKKECLILSILPSGVSAFEMFVMTRSYMFSRVYQHPKVRVAERKLTRAIEMAVRRRLEDQAQGQTAALDLLYGMNGDDGCIQVLDYEAGSTLEYALSWRKPRRVLALTPSSVVGFDHENGQPTPALLKAWSIAADTLGQHPEEFEQIIAEKLGTSPDGVIVDWQRPPTIKENPAVFVDDRFSTKELVPISRAFDIGQLAKAYENVKSQAWVFVEHDELPRAAAIAATVMNKEFGLAPLIKAVTDAKINPDDYREALSDLSKDYDELFADAAEGVDRALGGNLTFPPLMLKQMLAPLGPDADVKAYELANGIAKAGLVGAHFVPLVAALQTLTMFLMFIADKAAIGNTYNLTLDEEEFQKEVHQWFRDQTRNNQDMQIAREAQAPTGRLDLLVSTGRGIQTRVVVELKAEEARLETSIANNKEQAFSYLTDTNVGRVGILFCRFRAKEEKRQSELIKLEFSGGPRPTVLICIGQHVPPDSASKLKHANTV